MFENAGNLRESELEFLLVVCTILVAAFDNSAVKIKVYQFYLNSKKQIVY